MGLSLDPIINFQINIIKIVWQTVTRIVKEILGVKGLKAYKQLIAAKTTYWMTPKYLRFQFLFENDLTSNWFRNFKNRFAPPQPHTNYFKRCFRYSSARVWYSQSCDLCSAVSFRASVHYSNFGVFSKNICHQFCDRCAEWIFSYHILGSLTNI